MGDILKLLAFLAEKNALSPIILLLAMSGGFWVQNGVNIEMRQALERQGQELRAAVESLQSQSRNTATIQADTATVIKGLTATVDRIDKYGTAAELEAIRRERERIINESMEKKSGR